MPRLPTFENRPGTDVAGLQAALVRYTQELRAFLGADVGPGAGTYGGDGEFVESVELDDQGRVLGVSTAPAGSASRAGSIFTMDPPTDDAATPVVAYDFTRFNSSLTLAQNLTAANQSGDSDYNLVAVGTPVYGFSATNIGGGTPSPSRTLQPYSAHVEGGSLLGNSGTNYAETAIHPPGLLLQAALTIEWLGYVFPGGPGGGSAIPVIFHGPGALAADNIQYALSWSLSTTSWTYTHESGVATADTVALLTTSSADETGDDQPRLITLTRSAAGLLTLYINGRRAAVSVTPGTSALPTGGSTGKLQLARANGSASVSLGVRIFDAALTAAQVQASYRRTFFGVA